MLLVMLYDITKGPSPERQEVHIRQKGALCIQCVKVHELWNPLCEMVFQHSAINTGWKEDLTEFGTNQPKGGPCAASHSERPLEAAGV